MNDFYQDMINYLTRALLEPDFKLNREAIDTLVRTNNCMLGLSHKGFWFKSHYLELGGEVTGEFTNIFGLEPKLHRELETKAEGLVKTARLLVQDYCYIRETFTLMTTGGRDWQDFRNDLPDCVIQFSPQLYSMPRTLSVEYNLRTNPRLQFRYQMLLPRLHTYSAMSLLT